MSYEPELLFEKVSACLRETPGKTLAELSRGLGVSRQTIEKAVHTAAGKTFKSLCYEILDLVKRNFASEPTMAIKELSFALGFRSASSFARTIKRVCGFSPQELRSRAGREMQRAEK